jgi:hypothetical protein
LWQVRPTTFHSRPFHPIRCDFITTFEIDGARRFSSQIPLPATRKYPQG